MFVVAERLFDLPALWHEIETTDMPEAARIALFDEVGGGDPLADRGPAARDPHRHGPGRYAQTARQGHQSNSIARPRRCCSTRRARRARGSRVRSKRSGAPPALVQKVVRLFELDGAVGLADLGDRLGIDETVLTRAFTRLGQALGLDWAQANAARINSSDPWERLLIAGLARDFQQLRLEFLARAVGGKRDPQALVDTWLADNAARVAQFKAVVDRARLATGAQCGDAGADRGSGAGAARAVMQRAPAVIPALFREGDGGAGRLGES